MTSSSDKEGTGGVYVASRVARAPVWLDYRKRGVPITSSWIDEAGEGETADFGELWARIQREIASSRALVFYAHGVEDFPFKGALVEVGMALALNKPVFVCINDVMLDGRTLRPLGSWALDRRVKMCDTLEQAMQLAFQCPLPESGTIDYKEKYLLLSAQHVREVEGLLRARCPGNGDCADPVECQSYEASEQGAPCPPGCCVMAETKDVRSILAAHETDEGEAPLSTTQPIGIVISHQSPGTAIVKWLDDGLRPIGMKVYATPLSTTGALPFSHKTSDERVHRAMKSVGMPDSISLYGALKQMENEIRSEIVSATQERDTGFSLTRCTLPGGCQSPTRCLREGPRCNQPWLGTPTDTTKAP